MCFVENSYYGKTERESEGRLKIKILFFIYWNITKSITNYFASWSISQLFDVLLDGQVFLKKIILYFWQYIRQTNAFV